MTTFTLNRPNRTAAVTLQRWLDDARKTGTREPDNGRRNQPRFTWDAQMTLEVLVEGEPVESHYANARDISAGGMSLRCKRPLKEGALVRITLDETEEMIHGRVLTCNEEICAHLIGVEFLLKS